MKKADRAVFGLNCTLMTQHGIILLIVGPLVPSIMQTFSIDEGVVGLLLGLGSVGFLFGPIVAGTIIDRSSVRWTLVAGFVIEILFLALFGISSTFFAAVAANVVLHFGSAFIEIGGNYMPTIVTGRSNAHSRMNLVHFFFSIGAFLGPFLIGLWLDTGGHWRTVFFFAMVPSALLLVWSLTVRFPAGPRTRDAGGRGRLIRDLSTVLSSKYAVFGAMTLLFYVGAEVGVSSWVVHYLQKIVGLNTVQSATGLSILWVFIMVGRYLNSALGKRLPAGRLVTISGLLGLGATLAFIAASSLPAAYTFLAVMGVALSGVFPNVMGALNNRDPARAGTVTGVMSTGAAAGAAAFQWIVGVVAEHAGLRAAFVVPAALQGLLVITFLFASADEHADSQT